MFQIPENLQKSQVDTLVDFSKWYKIPETVCKDWLSGKTYNFGRHLRKEFIQSHWDRYFKNNFQRVEEVEIEYKRKRERLTDAVNDVNVVCVANKRLTDLKRVGIELNKQVTKEITFTKCGSGIYNTNGRIVSQQSYFIKRGHWYQDLLKEIIVGSDLQLLKCGVRRMTGGGSKKGSSKDNKDIDLVFVNEITKTIYLREVKCNMNLDTEKLDKTTAKMAIFKKYATSHFPDYTANICILYPSVFSIARPGKELDCELSEPHKHRLKECEKVGVRIEFFEDFCKLVGLDWPVDDYYNYLRSFGAELLLSQLGTKFKDDEFIPSVDVIREFLLSKEDELKVFSSTK
jgi:hypothetical protein